jgi:hypothetical protein
MLSRANRESVLLQSYLGFVHGDIHKTVCKLAYAL